MIYKLLIPLLIYFAFSFGGYLGMALISYKLYGIVSAQLMTLILIFAVPTVILGWYLHQIVKWYVREYIQK